MTSKAPFHWLPVHQKAFEQTKAILSTNALLAYPNTGIPYDVETDTSDYHLGSVIKQENCPVTYFSRKLNSAQKNYTTIEKGPLSIVETFKEFCSILLGSVICIHTDHKNLTHIMTTFNTQCILQWRLQLEEFKPTFLYKTRNSNIITDALSRIPTETNTHSHTVVQQLPANVPSRDSQLLASDQEFLAHQDNYISYNTNLPHDCILPNTPNLAECLLEHPIFDTDSNLPFQFPTIHEYQQNDQTIANLATTQPEKHTTKNLGGHNFITLFKLHNKLSFQTICFNT